MMNIEDSLLYKNLIFFEKYGPPSFNVKEIYWFIMGYQLAASEDWIADFHLFLGKKLLKLYTDQSFDKLPKNFGEFIDEHQSSDADGLSLFLIPCASIKVM